MDEIEEIYNENNIDGVKLMSLCPVCNAKYHSSEMKILEEKSNGHLIHVQCKKCKSCVIAVVYAHNAGVSSVCLITDLMSNDVVKFKDKNPFCINDVIDLHVYLHLHKIIDYSTL